jgi:nucleoside-diphosphate-sugar epimerase
MSTSVTRSVESLDEALSRPRDATIAALASCPGDLVILGAGGKMGPTLARMAARAMVTGSGPKRRVIAVSRFTSPNCEHFMNSAGVETIRCDLTDRNAVHQLPDAPNVVFMAGQKFGTSESPERTWLMNVVVPAICVERYPAARMVAFSTGNVYPFVPVASGGARESSPTGPVGEYAASCVGRERIFEGAALHRARVAIMRLNYAIDLRYGVLADLASRVLSGAPISLAMGHVNLIWQGDANRAALELLPHAAAPALVVNVTGTETLSVRWLATELGSRLGRAPLFEGTEADDALLSDTSRMQSLIPRPEVPIGTMLDWTAAWAQRGGEALGKPTHFGVRDGAF